jgi:hypothetical protein
VGHEADQGGLAKNRRLARHMGSRDEGKTLSLHIEFVIVGDKGPRG